MNKNAKLIAGLKAIQEGLSEVITALNEEGVSEVKEKATVGGKATAPTTAPTTKTKAKVEEPEEDEEGSEEVTQEFLDAMTYNNLKAYCKEIGVIATGNRAEITARILKESGSAVEEEDDEEEEAEDPIIAQVMEAVAEMSNEEIADLLTSLKISPKGKREALIEKVVQAVRDGLIDLDGEEEEEEEEKPVKSTKASDKKAATSKKAPEPEPEDEEDEDEDDGVNDLENEDMTESRAEAIQEFEKSTKADIKKKELTQADMIEFLQGFHQTEEDLSEYTKEEIIEMYLDAAFRLIDDDGDIIEEGAYQVNGVPFCCGHALKLDKKKKKFICETCGETYDAED